MPHPRIGLALGSGAARGWAHIGVLAALRRAGIEPDIVCGTSMGAFVGAAYVSGRLDDLERWARRLGWREILRHLDINVARGGLVAGQRLAEFYKALVRDVMIESMPLPFAAVATDLETGREIWLQLGSAATAVSASIAIPGIFSPVRIDGTWLADGGLVNPVPVSVCRALGAEFVLAVDVNDDILGVRYPKTGLASADGELDEEPPVHLIDDLTRGMRRTVRRVADELLRSEPSVPRYFDVVVSAINITQDYIRRSRLAAEPPHVRLTPLVNRIRILDFNRADEAIEEGYAAVERALPTLLPALGRA